MASQRTKSVGTKVTAAEYARLEALAGEQSISQWVREVLLDATRTPVNRVLLAELLALRTILLNLHFSLCRGEPITAESMARFIERADQDKVCQAHDRLAATERRT